MDVSRLRGAGLQRGQALRQIRDGAARGGQAARREGRRSAARGARLPHGRRAVQERERHHQRPHRRGEQRVPRAHRELRALPRPHVRPDPDEGLLRAARRLREHLRAGGRSDAREQSHAGAAGGFPTEDRGDDEGIARQLLRCGRVLPRRVAACAGGVSRGGDRRRPQAGQGWPERGSAPGTQRTHPQARPR